MTEDSALTSFRSGCGFANQIFKLKRMSKYRFKYLQHTCFMNFAVRLGDALENGGMRHDGVPEEIIRP